MATMPNPPYESEQEPIKLTVSGHKINEDLSLYTLPGGTVDLVVDGKDAFVARLEDPEEGTSLSLLATGHNLFVNRTGREIQLQIYSRVVPIQPLPSVNVSTTVIVIPPPHPPKFPTGGPTIVQPGQQ
jgi:hypothetical protein